MNEYLKPKTYKRYNQSMQTAKFQISRRNLQHEMSMNGTVAKMFVLSPQLEVVLPIQTGPTNPSRAPAADRSSSGTLYWNSYRKRSSATWSRGRATTASSSSRTPMSWPGCGEWGNANRTWTTTSSAARFGKCSEFFGQYVKIWHGVFGIFLSCRLSIVLHIIQFQFHENWYSPCLLLSLMC